MLPPCDPKSYLQRAWPEVALLLFSSLFRPSFFPSPFEADGTENAELLSGILQIFP